MDSLAMSQATAPSGMSHPYDLARAGAEPVATISVAALLNLVRRHLWWIVGLTGAATLIAGAILLQVSPRYQSEAVVRVEKHRPPVPTQPTEVREPDPDDLAVTSEIEAILSVPVLDAVIASLDLVHDPEFNPNVARGDASGVSRVVAEAKTFARDLRTKIDALFNRVPRIGAGKDLLLVRQELRRAIWVGVKGKSRIIIIRATSVDAEKAAKIANAMASSFIKHRLDTTLTQDQRITDWLHDRLAELRQRVVQSEQEIERLRSGIGQFEGQTAGILSEQLTHITRQLVDARAEQADAEAKFAQLRRLRESKEGGIETANDVLASPLIQRLREQEAALLAERGRMAPILGQRHPGLISVNTQLKQVRDKITTEIDKIAQNIADRIEFLRTRINALENEKQQLEKRIDAQNSGLIRLREVQRDAETNRTTYEAFAIYHSRMAGLGEIEQGQTEFLSPAVPAANPSSPAPLVTLVAVAVIAAALSFLVIVIREGLDHGLHGANEVGAFLGLPTLAVVPRISRKSEAPEDHVLMAPESTAVEAIRSLLASVDRVRTSSNRPVRILISSSLPGEGKTVTSIMLAREAALVGFKTLLVNLDVRRQHGAAIFSAGEALPVESGASFGPVIGTEESTGLSVVSLRCYVREPFKLLCSPSLWRQLDRYASDFEFVIMDSPPILSVPDAKVIAGFADIIILLAKWGTTKRHVVAESVRQFRGVGAEVHGVVLTQVDPLKYAKYGFGDSEAYGAANRA
jgi:succinoglycan biosynthesis transport protein ExoP